MNKKKIISVLKNTAAIIVMISLLTIIYYQNRDRDLFKFSGSENGTKKPENENNRIFEGYYEGDIGVLEDEVALITPDIYAVFDEKGEGSINNVTISDPCISTDGEFALYRSKNTKEAYIYKREKPAYTVKSEEVILKAKVTKTGYSVIVTQKEGYSAEITVYNKTGEPVFKWNLSESEFLDVSLNSDKKKIVISSVGADKKHMNGEITLIDISTAEVIQKTDYKSELFYSVDFNFNGTFIALGSDRLIYFNASGTEKWNYPYKERTLLQADYTDSDMIVLAFSAIGSGIKGNSTEIEIIGSLGDKKAKVKMSGLCDDISVSDRKVAVAFGKEIYVLDDKLSEIKKIETETSVKKLAFYNDGKHIFVLGNSGGKIVN